jgi:nanoRNase/pAp phosphatase (c-di-AMP/oligoRNAs hydrolase)
MSARERVQFEGHDVWAINGAREFRSIVGNYLAESNLAEEETALGIVYYRNNGNITVSLRSIGEVDVAAMAEKYGGGGHKNAAAIRVKNFADLPFKFIE